MPDSKKVRINLLAAHLESKEELICITSVTIEINSEIASSKQEVGTIASGTLSTTPSTAQKTIAEAQSTNDTDQSGQDAKAKYKRKKHNFQKDQRQQLHLRQLSKNTAKRTQSKVS